MLQTIERHPSEIRVGDRINHAGAIVEVLAVSPPKIGRSWRLDIRDEYTGGINFVFYRDSGIDSTVRRYENN